MIEMWRHNGGVCGMRLSLSFPLLPVCLFSLFSPFPFFSFFLFPLRPSRHLRLQTASASTVMEVAVEERKCSRVKEFGFLFPPFFFSFPPPSFFPSFEEGSLAPRARACPRSLTTKVGERSSARSFSPPLLRYAEERNHERRVAPTLPCFSFLFAVLQNAGVALVGAGNKK